MSRVFSVKYIWLRSSSASSSSSIASRTSLTFCSKVLTFLESTSRYRSFSLSTSSSRSPSRCITGFWTVPKSFHISEVTDISTTSSARNSYGRPPAVPGACFCRSLPCSSYMNSDCADEVEEP